jgi:tetratricopeptide (TPR) repeat protein
VSEPTRQLDDELHARIVALTDEARAFEEKQEWVPATAKLEQALALVPEPQWDWEAATWLFIAIGDVAFQSGDYERAREAFRQAMLCPGAIGNPFVHLRRGQTFFELGEMKWAEEELAGAYMLEGVEIFEDEDPKYLAHLKTVLQPPATGDW